MTAGLHRRRARVFSIIHKYFKQVSLRLFVFDELFSLTHMNMDKSYLEHTWIQVQINE